MGLPLKLLLLQGLARVLQSRVSEVFDVDIHPGATIGRGVLIDHASGVVIGETALVGDNVSMLHHVTLGGSGVGSGIRHPTVGNGVLLGAGACLGAGDDGGPHGGRWGAMGRMAGGGESVVTAPFLLSPRDYEGRAPHTLVPHTLLPQTCVPPATCVPHITCPMH